MFSFFRTQEAPSQFNKPSHPHEDVIKAFEDAEEEKIKLQKFADELGIPLEEAREARIKIGREFNNAHMVRGLSETKAIEDVMSKNPEYTKEQVLIIMQSIWGVDEPGIVVFAQDRTSNNPKHNLH